MTDVTPALTRTRHEFDAAPIYGRLARDADRAAAAAHQFTEEQE